MKFRTSLLVLLIGIGQIVLLLSCLSSSFAVAFEHREPVIFGLLDKVTRCESGQFPNTSYEMSSLATTGLATIGLSVMCGYYYGLYKGIQFVAQKTPWMFSSLGDLVKSSYTKLADSALINKFR